MSISVSSLLRGACGALIVALTACAPAPTAGGGSASQAAAPKVPKTLTVAVQREAEGFTGLRDQRGEEAAGLVHDGLVQKTQGAFLPQLAQAQISVESGTWKVNADGSMDTNWKIRPNVKWHDGTPFTSADVLFAYNVRRDPNLSGGSGSVLKAMASAAAPDPLTFTTHWSEVNVRANEAVGLIPLPKHLLESVFAGGPEALLTSPIARDKFVGTGPYRLTNWDQGLQMELTAFDAYYAGKPPIDRIFLKVVLDPTAMVANILAGAVDVVVPPGVDLETAADIKSRWQGTGNQVIVGGFEDMNSSYTLQFRPEYVKPKNGGTANRDVREALLRGIDRPLMTETITAGLALVADSWVSPNHRLRAELESAIPQYPYDLNRAQQLLTQAGWARGSDGVLVNSDGEKLEIELAGPVRTALQKQQAIISDGWKPLGVVGQIYVVSAVDDQNAETRSIRPSTYLGSIAADRYYFEDQLHSREITGPNNWGKRNRGGYSSPVLDASLDKLRGTIDGRERTAGYREQLRIAMSDVALWPLYWDVYPVLAVAGVKADVIHPAKGGVMANILDWDKS